MNLLVWIKQESRIPPRNCILKQLFVHFVWKINCFNTHKQKINFMYITKYEKIEIHYLLKKIF